MRRGREGVGGLREETKALAWSPRSSKGQLQEGRGGLGRWHLGADGVSRVPEQEQKEAVSGAEDCHPQQRPRWCLYTETRPRRMLLATGRPSPAIYKRKWLAAVCTPVTLSVCAHVAACPGNNTSCKMRTMQAFNPVLSVRSFWTYAKQTCNSNTDSFPFSLFTALPAMDVSHNPNTTTKTMQLC